MKKVLLIFLCLLLFGCSNKKVPDIKEDIEMSKEAQTLANDLKLDFNKLDLDVEIIDANKTAFTLYLSREVTDKDAINDFNKINDFIKMHSKKEKIYDYYNPDVEFDNNTITEQTTSIFLKTTIRSKDYKVSINRASGLSYKGSEKTYSIYKINFLEKDFSEK